MAKKKVTFMSTELGREITIRDTDEPLELNDQEREAYQRAAGIKTLKLDYAGSTLEEKVYDAQEGIKPKPCPSRDRDKKGQFRNGNQGGPGNPYARRVAELRKLLLEEVTADKLKTILAALLAKAEAGDVPAAKLVLQYTIGKPTAAPDPDQLDVEEWKLTKRSGLEPEEVAKAGRQVPVQEALKGTSILRDIFYVGQREALGEKLCEHTELNGWQKQRFDEENRKAEAEYEKIYGKPYVEEPRKAASMVTPPKTASTAAPARASEAPKAPSPNGSIRRPAGVTG